MFYKVWDLIFKPHPWPSSNKAITIEEESSKTFQTKKFNMSFYQAHALYLQSARQSLSLLNPHISLNAKFTELLFASKSLQWHSIFANDRPHNDDTRVRRAEWAQVQSILHSCISFRPCQFNCGLSGVSELLNFPLCVLQLRQVGD